MSQSKDTDPAAKPPVRRKSGSSGSGPGRPLLVTPRRIVRPLEREQRLRPSDLFLDNEAYSIQSQVEPVSASLRSTARELVSLLARPVIILAVFAVAITALMGHMARPPEPDHSPTALPPDYAQIIGEPAADFTPVKFDKTDTRSTATTAEVLELQSKIKFIAGMIAIHQPQIPDCGALAREIVDISRQKNTDPFFIAAIISVESRFSTSARSHVGAGGLMQLMPYTAHTEKHRDAFSRQVLSDIRLNILLGIDYFRKLEAKYHGNRVSALAAYNWGPSNVDRVSGNPAEFPKGVRSYASTIIKRSQSWANHYEKARQSAEAFDQKLEGFISEEQSSGAEG